MLEFLKHCFVVAFAFVAMWVLAELALNMSFLSPVAHAMSDFSLTDIYYHVLNEYSDQDTSRVVTIVDMTDLRDRREIAEVIDSIESCQPKVLGIDIVFEGESDNADADKQLIETIKKSKHSELSYRMSSFIDDSIGYVDEIHSFFADSIAVDEGFTNFERSLYGGMKRKVGLQTLCNGERRKSLVMRIAERFTDNQLITNSTDNVSVNFKPTVFRIIPCDSISHYRDLIEGNICLLGAARELCDTHYTPIGEMAGIVLLAYSVQTLLEQKEVVDLPVWITITISFVIVLLTYLGRLRYMKWANGLKNEWLKFLLTSTFVVGLLIFLWTALLIWAGFIIFNLTGVSMNLGWAMAAIPFLGGAGEFYGLTISRIFRK